MTRLSFAIYFKGLLKIPQLVEIDSTDNTTRSVGVFQDGRYGSAVIPDFRADDCASAHLAWFVGCRGRG